MIKIIFCTDGIFPFAIGGMQRHSRLLIEELAKSPDIELVVVHPHNKQVFNSTLNIKEERIQGIDIHKNYLRQCKGYSKRMLDVVRLYPEHIIYSQGLCIWERIDSVKNRLIVNPHGLEPFQAISVKDKLIALPFKKVFSRIFRKANKVVSLGGMLTEILHKITPNNVVVLPNAVNLPKEPFNRSVNTGKLQALFVGRFATNKGIHILMNAISKNFSNNSNIIFNLAGKGPLFELYKEKYKHLSVNFLGFVSDKELEKLYITNDFMVLPTLFEGMPTVVLEAMAHKMPVIVTNVGATAELVDEKNGFLIEKNNVTALTDALDKIILMDFESRKQLGLAGYEKVKERFIWNKVALEHIKLFNKMH